MGSGILPNYNSRNFTASINPVTGLVP